MEASRRFQELVPRLFRPVDAASLVFVRVAFGLVVLWEAWRYVDNGWIAAFYIRPELLDARLGLVPRSEFVPFWSVFLLRAQVAIVYFFAGIAKIDRDWLQAEPMRSWLAARTDVPILGRFFREQWAGFLFSWGGLLFDLTIVPLLAWRRTRPFAFVGAVLFHLMNARLFEIGIFPWLMLSVSTLFFDPGWPRKVFAFIDRTPGQAPAPWPVRRTVLAVGGAYLALQVAFPLRHLLYPGPVAWTEEGHRFSWRMKLRDKEAAVQIRVRDAKSGESWIEPLGDLTTKQRRTMAAHPDMILQYAHYLARLYREDQREVEVYAVAKVSLNGRAPQLLVDPAVDLAKQPRDLRHAAWIRPFDARATEKLAEDALEVEE